jgi:hypothetical protein
MDAGIAVQQGPHQAGNRLDKGPQLSGLSLDSHAEGLHDCRIVGQTTHIGDLSEALINQGRPAAVMLPIEVP